MITGNKTSKIINIVIDLFIINISFLFAAHFAQSLKLLFSNGPMLILIPVLNFTWIAGVNIIKIYDELNLQNTSTEYYKFFKILLLLILTTISYLFVIKEPLFLRNFLLYLSTFIFTLYSLKIFLSKIFQKTLIKKGIYINNILIITNEKNKSKLQSAFKENPFFNIVDMIFQPLSNGHNSEDFLENIKNILSKEEVDDVIISLSENASELDQIVKICNINAVRTHIIPDYTRFISNNFEINIVNNFPLITLRKEALAEFHWKFLKRFFDILISLPVVLLIFPPLFLIVAVVQKLTSPGPIFFLQERIGLKDKSFKCIKFRSMTINSEKSSIDEEIENLPNRITKFGRFLRKTNLDEMPQFLNVLFGQMTIVGPRPNALSFHKEYMKYIDEFNLRHLVKPGITGWAQIHGFRGDSSNKEEQKERIRKRFEYDMWYIDNWSIKLDIQIISQTFWQIIKGKAQGT